MDVPFRVNIDGQPFQSFAFRAVADHDQMHLRPNLPQSLHCPDKITDPLLLGESADIADQKCVRRQLQRGQ
jgi:hypothetical protein